MKKILAGVLSLVTAFAGVACMSQDAKTDSNGQNGKRKLVVSTWGLGEDKLMADVFQPFEEKYNVEVVLEMAGTNERLTKLKENPQSEIDVIELSQSAATEAQDLNLVDKIDSAKIGNISQLIAPAKIIADKGFGVPYVINSIGIIYNPNGAMKEIKDWQDLWRESLKGRIAIPNITTTFGPAMLAVAGDVAGTPIDKDNAAAAFKKLEELKPNIVKAYAKSSDIAMMFANGEVDAAIVGDFAYNIIKKAMPEAKYVIPMSGTYANFNTIEINKNSKNKDLALEYINFRISQEIQMKTAKSLNDAPTNKSVELDEETKGNKTYGEIVDRAKVLDFNFVNKNIADWVDKFNRLMNN